MKEGGTCLKWRYNCVWWMIKMARAFNFCLWYLLVAFLLIRARSNFNGFSLPFVNQAPRHERKQHPNEWHAIKGGEILAENSKTNGATVQGRINDGEISVLLFVRGFSLFLFPI